MKPLFFDTAADFRQWLVRHHARETKLLVGFHKKATGCGITYQEALDEALAYGWIDGVRKRVDDSAYSIRFTPRRPGSIWSVVNTKRVEELIARKRMAPPGLRAFEQRNQAKTRQYSYERENPTLTPALDAALRANAKAATFFDAQPPGYRRLATFWIMSAKRDETRAQRMAKLIGHSAKSTRIDFMKSS